jgi:hypothetical protein
LNLTVQVCPAAASNPKRKSKLSRRKKCLREKAHQSLLLDVAPNLFNVGRCWKMEAEVMLMAGFCHGPVGWSQVFQTLSPYLYCSHLSF